MSSIGSEADVQYAPTHVPRPHRPLKMEAAFACVVQTNDLVCKKKSTKQVNSTKDFFNKEKITFSNSFKNFDHFLL